MCKQKCIFFIFWSFSTILSIFYFNNVSLFLHAQLVKIFALGLFYFQFHIIIIEPLTCIDTLTNHIPFKCPSTFFIFDILNYFFHGLFLIHCWFSFQLLPLIFFFSIYFTKISRIFYLAFFLVILIFSFIIHARQTGFFEKKNFLDYLKFYQMSPAVHLTISSIEKSSHYLRAKKIQLPIVFYWPPSVW